MLGVTILGNNSAIPAHDRHPTSQVLHFRNELALIDCGEGTQMQIARYKIKYTKINHIFISHLHGDHYFGLIGLLTSWGLINRDTPLHVYAPPLLLNIIYLQLNAANTKLPYELVFHALDTEGKIAETPSFTVETFLTTHRIPCWGFLFIEKKVPRKVDREKAFAHQIPYNFFDQLQKGAHYIAEDGSIVMNEWVTTPNTPPKTYAYCADSKFDASIPPKIKGANLVYHETTYLKNLQEKAEARFHSTTTDAANIALLAEAKQLIIGHFSSNYSALDEFVTEARSIFPKTYLATEGTTFRIL
ncbi:MAG: ribonuclease Z [Chitinophagaceae bacterium]